MTRVWLPPILFLLCGTGLAVGLLMEKDPGTAVALLLLFVLLAGVNSPLVFPRSIDAEEARRRSAVDGRPVVFWRPGCAYCLRLRLRLGRRARRAHWVDIWRDPEGAAVRAANDGNETVPTVVVAGRSHVNPDPAWVREQLSRSA